jgi:uncharacterized membrane protein
MEDTENGFLAFHAGKISIHFNDILVVCFLLIKIRYSIPLKVFREKIARIWHLLRLH